MIDWWLVYSDEPEAKGHTFTPFEMAIMLLLLVVLVPAAFGILYVTGALPAH